MINYNLEFMALDCAPLESGFADVIKTVHWRAIASEPKSSENPEAGFYTAVRYGSLSLDPITDSGAFIAFDQVTTGIVSEWVNSKINISGENGIYSSLAADIEVQKNPPIVRRRIGVSGSFPI